VEIYRHQIMKILKIFSSRNVKIALIAFFTLTIFSRFTPTIISWDVLAHYLYLPATFIYDDPGIKDHDGMFARIEQYGLSTTFYQVVKHENGNHIIKTTSGLSVILSPFFFAAHAAAHLGAGPADGFSRPYQFAVMLSSVLFIILGLVYVRKILKKLFDDKTALTVLLILSFGTNLYITFTTITSVHLYMFGLYAFFIWQVIRWHEDPDRRKAFVIGVTAGFITLLRPTDAICMLIPLLWGIYDLASFRKKIILFATHFTHVLLLIAGGIITLLPQIIYWKATTGSFIYYSYATPGEGLDFFNPYIYEVLFSFRKGWLIYTPIMLFALGGFISLFKHMKTAFYPILIFTLLNIFLISSWSCWWYADSFGHRAFIHTYPLMAIPLGAFVFDILKRVRLFTFLSFFVMVLFVFLNLFQTKQFSKGIIHPSRMTAEYYWAVFGKRSMPEQETQKLMLIERSFAAEEQIADPDRYFVKHQFTVDFSQMPEVPTEQLYADSSGMKGVVLNQDYIYTPAWQRAYFDMTNAEHLYFKIKTKVFLYHDPIENPFSLVVHFTHKGGPYKYRTLDSENPALNLKVNEWNDMELLYLSPEIRTPHDKFSVYFWLRGNHAVVGSTIEIQVLEPQRGW